MKLQQFNGALVNMDKGRAGAEVGSGQGNCLPLHLIPQLSVFGTLELGRKFMIYMIMTMIYMHHFLLFHKEF